MGSLRSSMHKESITGEAASTAISPHVKKARPSWGEAPVKVDPPSLQLLSHAVGGVAAGTATNV
jgi:hypothetical protein